MLPNCATMKESILTGVATGAVAGAAASSALMCNHIDNRDEKVLNTAVLGAVVGGIGAYLIHSAIEKRDDKVRRETLLNLERFDVSVPSELSDPNVPGFPQWNVNSESRGPR